MAFLQPDCRGRDYKAAHSSPVIAPGWCRKKRDLEEEEAEGASSGEDEFYDRTLETRKKRSKAAAHVEDAASLYGQKVCQPNWTCQSDLKSMDVDS